MFSFFANIQDYIQLCLRNSKEFENIQENWQNCKNVVSINENDNTGTTWFAYNFSDYLPMGTFI